MKKRPLTDEQKAECLALKNIFLAKKKELGLSQEKAGQFLDMSAAAVNHYLNGVNALNVSVASGFARMLGVSVADFSGRLAAEIESMSGAVASTSARQAEGVIEGEIGEWADDSPLEDDEVVVPFLKEVEVAAGTGRTVIVESGTKKLRLGRYTLRRKGVDPHNAICVTVKGNSMTPILPDGSTIGVDRGCTRIIDGDMYALNHDGMLRVKCLQTMPGNKIRLRSFNRDEYDDEIVEPGEIEVIGRVFWYSVLV